jgi:tetratricopeptide (TPR) repeat protein
MERLYEYILEGIEKSGNFHKNNTNETFESYLQTLQLHVKSLRQDYKPSGKSVVKVDYSHQSVQAAYLIAYYPQYVEMTLAILKSISSELKFGNEVQACFFGAGPCPEVAALVQFLAEHSPNTTKLNAKIYDIASDTWTISREVTTNHILPKLWNGTVELHGNKFDLCAKNCFQAIEDSIENSHVFIFQNCLNELSEMPNVKDNMDLLLKKIPHGSLVIVADLNYDTTYAVMDKMIENIDNQYILKPIDYIELHTSLNIPPIIRNNLLTGADRLIPRKKVVFCSQTIVKNAESHVNMFTIQISNTEIPHFGKKWYDRGLEKSNSGDNQGAIVNFNNAVNADPKNCQYYFSRAFSKLQVEQYQDSIEDCTHIITLDIKFTIAYHCRAEAKTKLGDYCGAIIDYDRTISDYDSNPNIASPGNHANAYQCRGNAKMKLGNYEGAISDYDRAVCIGNKNADVYRSRGNAKGNLGDNLGAISDYKIANELVIV